MLFRSLAVPFWIRLSTAGSPALRILLRYSRDQLVGFFRELNVGRRSQQSPFVYWSFLVSFLLRNNAAARLMVLLEGEPVAATTAESRALVCITNVGGSKCWRATSCSCGPVSGSVMNPDAVFGSLLRSAAVCCGIMAGCAAVCGLLPIAAACCSAMSFGVSAGLTNLLT